jgi:hypothetical protein
MLETGRAGIWLMPTFEIATSLEPPQDVGQFVWKEAKPRRLPGPGATRVVDRGTERSTLADANKNMRNKMRDVLETSPMLGK